jgi:hypothetical protein
MVLRRITGMELPAFIDARLAKPMGWGAWGYCLHRGGFTCRANGAGSIAVQATTLRFDIARCAVASGTANNSCTDYIAKLTSRRLQSALSIHPAVRYKFDGHG